MANKAEILMHPVRMKIMQALMRNKKDGLTPLQMVRVLEDVPQATIYRHIHVLAEANIIHVLKEKKVRAVSEKYYIINEAEMKLKGDEWESYTIEEKLNYISYYQLILSTEYQNYLQKMEQKEEEVDKATFSLVDLKLNDTDLEQFQADLEALVMKYYQINDENKQQDATYRTVGITIIPET